jgi:hypothetical protein
MKASMKKQLLAACLLSILVPCSAFATVYIDHFSAPTGGQSLTLTGVGSASSFTSSLGSSTLSGSRYLYIDKTSETGGSYAVDINNSAFPSLMASSLESGAIGSAKVIWDGNNNGVVDYTMAAVDLTEGGLNNTIDFRLIANDKPGQLTFNFGDGTTSADYTFDLPDYTNTYPLNVSIPFTAWSGVDFSQIKGAGMFLDLLASQDLRIDYISTGSDAAPVPEPSTFLLLGAGIAGIGIMRRRSTKKGASFMSAPEAVSSL